MNLDAGLGTPWPLRDVLGKLVEAVDHLFDVHDCDTHGYESFKHARDAARSYLAEKEQTPMSNEVLRLLLSELEEQLKRLHKTAGGEHARGMIDAIGMMMGRIRTHLHSKPEDAPDEERAAGMSLSVVLNRLLSKLEDERVDARKNLSSNYGSGTDGGLCRAMNHVRDELARAKPKLELRDVPGSSGDNVRFEARTLNNFVQRAEAQLRRSLQARKLIEDAESSWRQVLLDDPYDRYAQGVQCGLSYALSVSDGSTARFLGGPEQRAESVSALVGERFANVWEDMKAKGYQYGEDALEQVRFGFELAFGLRPDRKQAHESKEPFELGDEHVGLTESQREEVQAMISAAAINEYQRTERAIMAIKRVAIEELREAYDGRPGTLEEALEAVRTRLVHALTKGEGEAFTAPADAASRLK